MNVALGVGEKCVEQKCMKEQAEWRRGRGERNALEIECSVIGNCENKEEGKKIVNRI